MPFQSTSNSHTGIMWFAFQRRQTTSKYPYNFITAVQNKIKAAVMNSTAFNSRRKGVSREYKACSDLFKGYSNKSIKPDSDSRKNFKCTDLLCTAVSETKTQKVLSNKLVRQMKTKRRKSKQLNFECLMKLLKVREKLLIDRTTYLFSLFELQKERLKSKGYMKQYMKVNKKQERLLYQMREERQYLKGLLDFNGRNQRLLPVKALGRLSNQSIERDSSTKQELCRTQNIPIFPGTFYQEYYSKRLLNLTTGSNIYYFDSKCNLFILSKGWNPLGYPVNEGANLIELSRPYIKQNLLDQLKTHATRNNNLPMIQADSNIKYENIVANHNEALELPSNKSYLKEFNETCNTICGKQETAMEDFTYLKTFLEELFNEDSAEILSLKHSNMLHLKNEDWPLKSVFAARMMRILIDKINIKTKNLDQLSVCEILKSHLSCVLGAIKLLTNDLFEFVLSVDNVHFYECLIMDLTFETIREYWEFPQEDATQIGCSLQLSKTLSSLFGRHLSQPRNKNVNIHTIHKFKMENSCDYLDNIVINEMYKSDVNWANYQYKEPELLKLLINELVILHLNEIIQCVISERIKH